MDVNELRDTNGDLPRYSDYGRLITMQSSLVTPLGYIQPNIYIAESEELARQYAFFNFTISKFEDLNLEKYRYFIRLKDKGVKEIYPVSWDSETGIKTFIESAYAMKGDYTMSYDHKVKLLIDSARGIYIPQHFVSDVSGFDITRWGLPTDNPNVQSVMDGPDNEWYWEAWHLIEGQAEYTDEHGHKWNLYLNGDLWAIRDDMTEEEWETFAG